MSNNLNTKRDSIDDRVNSIETDVKETKSLQLNCISEEVAKHEEVIIRRVK